MASKGMATVTVAELPGMKEEFKEAFAVTQIVDTTSIIARLDGAPQATKYFQIITIDIFHHHLGAPLAIHPLLLRSGPIALQK